MTFEVEVAGRTFTVAVERTDGPGRFRVTLDGVLRLVAVSRTGDFGLSLLETRGTVPLAEPDTGTVPLSGVPFASRDVQVVPGGDGGEVLVRLRGRCIIQERGQVRGLTTAATIWVVAAIGIIAGAGFPLLAFVGALLVVTTLALLRVVEKWLSPGLDEG
jgi:hypothetical protein